MARRGRARSEERRSYWQTVVELQRESGLSVRQFCRQESLAESAFYFWRRALQPAAELPPAVAAPPQFVPVRIQATGTPLEIELTSGTKIRVREGCTAELLRSVLESLPC